VVGSCRGGASGRLRFLTRRGGLSRDGLWHDDAVTAVGAVKGSLSQLLVTGFDHPGFTAGLRAWDRLVGYDAASFAAPAFVVAVELQAASSPASFTLT
jgi:hypothetical protein